MADETLDCRGLICPKPLIETQKKLKRMELGKTLEVVGDFPPSKKEIPETMVMQGHEIISLTEKDGVWHIVIKKMK